MRNPNHRKRGQQRRQPSAIRTIDLRQSSQDERDGHILHHIGVHAGGHEDGIVGIAIWLLNSLGGLAILGDDFVALPGIEFDAVLDHVEGEEGGR